LKKHENACTYNNNFKSAVTIGTFDGVHIGHKKIIERLTTVAKENNLESIILTFFPHPRMVLQKDANIKLINTMEERSQILEKTGLNHLVVHPFSTEFSQLSAKEYVQQMLVKYLKSEKVIIGYDHRFGKGRTANIQDLITYGNKYLGYNFMLTGKIEKGKQLGRTLGYPTANLHVMETYKLIPKSGVYVVKSCIDNQTYYGMMNIGTNPTVGGNKQTIETYFFDAEFNLYDKKLQIELLTRIRDEKKFNSMNELKEAMSDDEDFAREYIDTHI